MEIQKAHTGRKNSKDLLSVYAQAIHSHIKLKDLDGGFTSITEFYLHLKKKQFFVLANMYAININIYSIQPSFPLQEAAEISLISIGTSSQVMQVLLSLTVN